MSTPHEQHLDQDQWLGNSEADEAYAKAMEEIDAQQFLVENCAGDSGHLGDASYPEGVDFCAGCGAQFNDPDHGSASSSRNAQKGEHRTH